MARSKKKALNDATNKKKKTKEKATTATKKLNEDQWRGHVLAFYKSDLPQSKYIVMNNIKPHPLRTRFDKSGLRNLKKCNTPYSDAVIQYDFWFKQWMSSLREKQALNSPRTNIPAGFLIRIDDDDGEDLTLQELRDGLNLYTEKS